MAHKETIESMRRLFWAWHKFLLSAYSFIYITAFRPSESLTPEKNVLAAAVSEYPLAWCSAHLEEMKIIVKRLAAPLTQGGLNSMESQLAGLTKDCYKHLIRWVNESAILHGPAVFASDYYATVLETYSAAETITKETESHSELWRLREDLEKNLRPRLERVVPGAASAMSTSTGANDTLLIQSILQAFDRFEALCVLCESVLKPENQPAYTSARERLYESLRGSFLYVLRGAPAHNIESIMSTAVGDYLQFHGDNPKSLHAPALSPALAVSEALAVHEKERKGESGRGSDSLPSA